MSALLKNLAEVSKKTFHSPKLTMIVGGETSSKGSAENGKLRTLLMISGAALAAGLIIFLIGNKILTNGNVGNRVTQSSSPTDNARMIYSQAIQSYQSGSFQNAKIGFEKLYVNNPNDPIALNNFALSQKSLGDVQEAKKLYLLGLSKFPNDAVLLDNYGTLEFEQGSLTIAEKNFQKSLAVRPLYREAMINLAHLYELKGEWIQSLHLYEALLKNMNNDPGLVQKISERVRKINSLSQATKNRGERI